MITVELADGQKAKAEKSVSGFELLKQSDRKDRSAVLGMKVDGIPKDLSTTLTKDAKVIFLTFDDEEGRDIFRHSSAHLMAQAVMALFPEAKPTIGPVVEEGFYYDFDIPQTIHPEDLLRIEKKMHELMKKRLPISREVLSKEKAKALFKDNPYKQELIDEFEGQEISVYSQGDFTDLCRGPHVPNTGMLKAFKLTKIAGAYWRADASRKQLQRIYGISFPDKEQLKEHLRILEEAEKRNHRKVGQDMELFNLFPEAPGMPFFSDKGTIIWNAIEGFLREELQKRQYLEVKTPLIMNKELWLKSGHWDHYKENMYFITIDDQEYAIKPMNCPGHALIYSSKVRSYRELPLRMAEFGMVHRHEMSGVLNGLFRVRKFTQDDAHIFCTSEQLEQEIIGCIDLVDVVYRRFGFSYHIELSTRPEKAMGSKEVWDHAETALKNALDQQKQPYTVNEGDGAFYGPKIDFHIKDCLGRTWQCATIQVDFSMPERFNLLYMGKDGENKHRPVMIHRAILGSFERFIGILIEHFAGKFPLWIAPRQVRMLTMNDSLIDFAESIGNRLKEAGIRVDYDVKAESIQKKVRQAQLDKVPLMLTIGDKEKTSNTLAVRTPDGKVTYGVDIDTFITRVRENIERRELNLSLE
ncbi:MAG: threonine--tRNA ligase [DPANN group archaeon]|nr:threonine--tRNA ligase [DPANN group archaeon]